ncbi:MAG TPA: cytochrome c biogenesis protein CcsA [Bacteroidota bacterium]|nr:cytochrome c biogenesis protein CcsA [Bacteroidota bacterium]
MIGSTLIRIAFVTILTSSVSYFYASRRGSIQLLNIGRYAYHATALLVLTFCSLFLYNILTHQFQYTYVWNYSSADLPTPLLVSTFYAGQEGSFSLWALFTTIIGIILMQYTSRKEYEAEVMAVWSMILSFLLLMLIVKNPFMHIWDSFPNDLVHTGLVPAGLTNFVWLDQAKGVWAEIPVKGKGLNPLLQNYWMVIHPQILFTGFSSMAVPYTFAVAGLLRRDYQSWVKVAKPWTVFGASVLGTGIILGGYWAYETLGWGGYWGWDPVENSSLIPWLVCVASIHTMMSQRRSGVFVRTNFVLSILCFIMVLYSTFLTRSGVLGETSVHSFVDPGMWAYWLLLGVIILFGVFGFGLLIRRLKEMPVIPVEHSIYSREFALFLGAFTICFAAVFITIGTSSPIITNILKGHAAAVDTSYYVKTVLPLGIVIAFLTGLGQLLWWRSSNAESLGKGAFVPGIASVLFAVGLWFVGVRDIPVLIFSLASAFALFVNVIVGYKIFVGNPKFAGGAIAHIGLALLFLGFVASARYDDKQTISLPEGQTKDILGGYQLTYLGSRQIDNERYGFTIQVRHQNDTYIVMPVMRYSTENNSMMRHPDILNMYTQDFYVSPLSVESPTDNSQETFTFSKGELKKVDGVSVKFVDFDFSNEEKAKMVTGNADVTIGVILDVSDGSTTQQVKPLFRRTPSGPSFVPARTSDGSKEFTIVRLQPNREDPAQSKVEIGVTDFKSPSKPTVETLVLEATIKPFINLVWMGTITLVVGFVVTIIRRVQEAREKES